MADRAIVDTLRTQLRIPAIVAPMFLISGPDLVISAGKAGLLGAIPAPNARTIPDLDAWFARISTELGEVERADLWAVNMIVHKSYDRFDAELDLICRYRPRIVVTALGSPRRVLDAVHGYGGAVFADTIDPNQAKKAIDAGADGLILVAHGAGGHTGRFNPFAFVEEVRSFWDGPLILGGGIATGRAIRAAEVLGADFAYLGTRFIAARALAMAFSSACLAQIIRAGLRIHCTRASRRWRTFVTRCSVCRSRSFTAAKSVRAGCNSSRSKARTLSILGKVSAARSAAQRSRSATIRERICSASVVNFATGTEITGASRTSRSAVAWKSVRSSLRLALWASVSRFCSPRSEAMSLRSSALAVGPRCTPGSRSKPCSASARCETCGASGPRCRRRCSFWISAQAERHSRSAFGLHHSAGFLPNPAGPTDRVVTRMWA